MSSSEPGRSPLEWDTPHADPPEQPLYHPRMLAWLAVEIPYLLRRWCWHKRQSLTASRTGVAFNATTALRKLEFIADDEDVPDRRREDAREAAALLVQVCDELQIEDERIGRVREQIDGGDE